jgi:hypothetical protein
MTNEAFMIGRPKASGKKDGHCAIYYTHDEEPLKWSAPFPLPNIGVVIRNTNNGIGPAEVVGYFQKEGYLGLMTKPLNPPEWLVKQQRDQKSMEGYDSLPNWRKNGIGCQFGAEIAEIVEVLKIDLL